MSNKKQKPQNPNRANQPEPVRPAPRGTAGRSVNEQPSQQPPAQDPATPNQPMPTQFIPVQPQPGQPSQWQIVQQPPQQAVPGAMQLPVPFNTGQQQTPNVQYVVMPHPTYWGQPPQIGGPSIEDEARRRRWRSLALFSTLLALGLLGLIWYGFSQGSLLAEPTGSTEIAGALGITDIVADARIQPARQVALSWPTGGIIQEALVSEGDVVEAGQLLMSLDNSRQVVAVAQAKATLDQAEARLTELETGARTQEIIAAQAAVDAAQARYGNLTAEVSAETLSAAEAQLTAAQAALQDLLNGPDANAEIEARAELQAAEAAVSRAQSAYDRVKWRNDVAMLPESQVLQEATTALEAARARSQQKLKGASAAEISQARAQVKEAEAELQRVRNPVPQGDIDAAAAELRSTQASLELVESGSRNEVVAFAQAEVSSAQAALLEAEVALKETELVAPYTGIVVGLEADIGEFVDPGTPVLQLGDLTTLKFETELEDDPVIARIDEGMPVLIKVNELNDLAMTGTVTSIKAITKANGDAAWSVFVEPDEVDERFTWKMRSQIYFDFE